MSTPNELLYCGLNSSAHFDKPGLQVRVNNNIIPEGVDVDVWQVR